jgi:hypothetical protein
MVTSGTMFFVGDAIAQFGIEGRRLGPDAVPQPEGYAPVDDDVVLQYNVSRHPRLPSSLTRSRPAPPARQCVRSPLASFPGSPLTTDGALVLAPLAHNWLARLDKVKFTNKWASESSAARARPR